jgi:hypothetical protein
VHDRGAGHEVVQGLSLGPEDDGEEAQAEQGDAHREHQGPQRGRPRAHPRPVGLDHPQAEEAHPQGRSDGGPRHREVRERPDHQPDAGDIAITAQLEMPPGDPGTRNARIAAPAENSADTDQRHDLRLEERAHRVDTTPTM